MAQQKRTAITPIREKDYPKWYLEVIKAADLAETSDVRGCMVIKPWGFSIWENMQRELDDMFRETGHRNAYFPLFIPLSYLQKEADHVDGFAKECAVVTHHRLEQDSTGKLNPAGELEEPLIVRPTSETIIGASYAKWVNSYRDLPILINQWANVVRWEMRTRMFLRTAEFLWQEGHTVHATEEEAVEETLKMLEVYREFAEEVLAIPVICGEKSESERFPGAVATYSIEAMMQDRKALQAGTSHFLGQKFAKASKIKFQNKEGKEEFAWTTSWGVSTRLIGSLIMVHADDNGMVFPPRIAPAHIVIIPMYKNDDDRKLVMEYIENLVKDLKKNRYHDSKIRVEIDDRDIKGGVKNWEWIKKGVPLKVEVGMRDIEKGSLAVLRRDDEELKKEFIDRETFVSNFIETLDSIQSNLFNRALKLREDNSIHIDSKDEFYTFFTNKNKKNPEIHGGFAYSHWCGAPECETKIKEDLKVTIRNIPLNSKEEEGKCICCGKPSPKRVIFAKSY
ncbi:MAG: proline--tRNA ligase [Candidatus Cloacimonadota bacterium]|nr:MAG: proline--tRNA ligase [Candidatus Cloacimonadota bacterium]PIE81253.1 MAG: proline--tRNA ligase [Candidatus Delongbacteria bacterium]